MSPKPRFLSVDDVVTLHAIAIAAAHLHARSILLTAIYRIAEDVGYEW